MPSPSAPAPDAASADVVTLDALLAARTDVRRGTPRRVDAPAHATGFAALDAALPARGWPIGGVAEVLVGAHGIGETSLLLPALRALTAAGRWAAFVRPPHEPYAPALVNAGVRLERLLVVDAPDDAEAAWAAERLLRSGRVAAVVLWLARTTPARQRRLQLAAETGGSWGTVYRPAAAAAEHSPVALRLTLEVSAGRLAVGLVKARGGAPGELSIAPSDFDAVQGAEWPIPTAPVAPDSATAAVLPLRPDRRPGRRPAPGVASRTAPH